MNTRIYSSMPYAFNNSIHSMSQVYAWGPGFLEVAKCFLYSSKIVSFVTALYTGLI